MSDLIDRQAAIDALNELSEHYTEKGREWHPHIDHVLFEIQSLPAADVRMIVRGEWIKEIKHHKDDEQEFNYEDIRCSHCGVRRRIGWYGANFCPNCGADMRGDSDV